MERKEIHYNNDDYNGVLWPARVSGLNRSIPLNVEDDLLFIQVVSVWIRLHSSTLFKYLTSYLGDGLETNTRLRIDWMRVHLYLILCIQMLIWLIYS